MLPFESASGGCHIEIMRKASKAYVAQRMTAPLLLLTGCAGNDAISAADEREIVRVILSAQVKEWQDSGITLPCVRSELARPANAGTQTSNSTHIDKSWLPAGFSICGVRPQSYYALSIDNAHRDVVLLSLDYQCGALCGQVESYQLDRIRGHWKVTKRDRRSAN